MYTPHYFFFVFTVTVHVRSTVLSVEHVWYVLPVSMEIEIICQF